MFMWSKMSLWMIRFLKCIVFCLKETALELITLIINSCILLFISTCKNCFSYKNIFSWTWRLFYYPFIWLFTTFFIKKEYTTSLSKLFANIHMYNSKITDKKEPSEAFGIQLRKCFPRQQRCSRISGWWKNTEVMEDIKHGIS